MSDLVQTIIVVIIIALAAGALLWRSVARRAKPGCGCNGCPTKPVARR